MLSVQELEREIAKLPSDELARLREWFDEYDANVWDKQFEQDAKSGKLDKLADRAIADFRAGRHKEL